MQNLPVEIYFQIFQFVPFPQNISLLKLNKGNCESQNLFACHVCKKLNHRQAATKSPCEYLSCSACVSKCDAKKCEDCNAVYHNSGEAYATCGYAYHYADYECEKSFCKKCFDARSEGHCTMCAKTRGEKFAAFCKNHNGDTRTSLPKCKNCNAKLCFNHTHACVNGHCCCGDCIGGYFDDGLDHSWDRDYSTPLICKFCKNKKE